MYERISQFDILTTIIFESVHSQYMGLLLSGFSSCPSRITNYMFVLREKD